MATRVLYSQDNIETLASLPTAVSETSGLIFFNNKLITHNDSGNTAQLFEIDTVSNEIVRSVTIANVENIDWEDIDQDEDHIYIGDFGNNLGMRMDLRILKIKKEDYLASDSVLAELIEFSYEDQSDFSNNGNSDWDAEAFFVFDDELILLTKQWQSQGTVAYRIPKEPGSHTARRIDSFSINGLVTSATYNPTTQALFIVGYSAILAPFVVRVEGVTETAIFDNTVTRTNLNTGFAQIESITYTHSDTYFLSSEFFRYPNSDSTIDAKLFRFVTEDSPPDPDTDEDADEDSDEDAEIVLFQRPGSDLIEYQLNTEETLLGRAIHDIVGKQVQYFPGNQIQEHSINISTLQNTVYFVTFYFDNRVVSLPFLKR